MSLQSFPNDLFPSLIEHIDSLHARLSERTFLACLAVCQAWYLPFKTALWRKIDTNALQPLMHIAGTPSPHVTATSLERLQTSLASRPDNGALVRELRLGCMDDLWLIHACGSGVQRMRLEGRLMAWPMQVGSLDPVQMPAPFACLRILQIWRHRAITAVLPDILARSPCLEEVEAAGLEVQDDSAWLDFAFTGPATPPIRHLSVSATGTPWAYSTFVNRVVMPLSASLEILHLEFSDKSRWDDLVRSSRMPALAHPENGASQGTFPRLVELKLTRLSLAWAANLLSVQRSPLLAKLVIVDPVIDFDPLSLVRGLPAGLQSVNLRPLSRVALLEFLQCMKRADWLPNLRSIPIVLDVSKADSRMFIDGIFEGLSKRGAKVPKREVEVAYAGQTIQEAQPHLLGTV